jgi:hypothetical protein
MACTARRSQLLVQNGYHIGSNQHRIKVQSNVYFDQQQASTQNPLHLQEPSEFRKCQTLALCAADTLVEWRCAYTQ